MEIGPNLKRRKSPAVVYDSSNYSSKTMRRRSKKEEKEAAVVAEDDQVEEENQSPECSTHEKIGLAQRFVRRALLARRMLYPQIRTESGKLPLWTKLVYAAPALALTSLTMLISIHGTIFFTKIGAKVSFLAFFTALARSFDVVTDPVMGYFSDGCKSDFGRRRPFMLSGCWFYAGFFVLLFTPPTDLDGLGVVVWFGLFYVLFYLADTTSNVPFNALGPELTEEAHERNSLFFYYGLFKAMGILMGAVAPVMFIFYFKSNPSSATTVSYSCNCEELVPNGMAYAQEQGYTWNSVWGNYSEQVYDYYNLCTENICNPVCEAGSEICDPFLQTGDSCAPGLDQWCADRHTCEASCDVGATRAGFHLTALLFGGYYVVAMLVCVLFLRERKNIQGAPKTPPLIPALLRTMRNRPFMTLVGPWALDYTAYTMIGTMLPFYVLYVVRPQDASPWCDDGTRCPGISMCATDADCCEPEDEDPNWCTAEYWLGIGLVFLMSATIVSTPIWLGLVKLMGKNRAWLMFNLLAAVTNGLFVFVGEGDPKLCVMMAMLNGLPNGAMFLNESILADVIDYEEFLTGERSEGRFTIFQTFIPKVVSIPAQAIPLGLLAAFGFVQPVHGVAQDQPITVQIFIKVVFFVLPCGLALLSFFLKTLYPIKTEKQMQQITEGIALHMKGLPAFDPITKKMCTPFSFASQAEEQMTWKMDCFSLPQLKLLATKGPEPLAAQIKFLLAQLVVVTIGILVVVIGSIAGGALVMPTYAWIPALFVILLGMCLCLCGIQVYRLRVLKGMMKNPIPQDLLDRWIVYISGVDYIRNREEMYRIDKILGRLSEHYRCPKQDMIKVISDLLPDVSGTAGMMEFAKQNSVLPQDAASPTILNILETINMTHAKDLAEEKGDIFASNIEDVPETKKAEDDIKLTTINRDTNPHDRVSEQELAISFDTVQADKQSEIV